MASNERGIMCGSTAQDCMEARAKAKRLDAVINKLKELRVVEIKQRLFHRRHGWRTVRATKAEIINQILKIAK